MPTRGAADVSGLRDIRSMHTASRRSIPRVQCSAYLHLYVLQQAKERLEKEAALLTKRLQAIHKRLEEIGAQMGGLGQAAQPEGPPDGVRKAARPSAPTKRQWKTLALKY